MSHSLSYTLEKSRLGELFMNYEVDKSMPIKGPLASKTITNGKYAKFIRQIKFIKSNQILGGLIWIQ